MQTETLNLPDIIGRLHQKNYVPVYKSNKKRRTAYHNFKQQAENWNYDHPTEHSHHDGMARPSYNGVRQSLSLPKVEAKYLKSRNKNHVKETAGKEIPQKSKEQTHDPGHSLDKSHQKTTQNEFHLPSLVKPFVPKEERKVLAKHRTKSTWIDLTGVSPVKQVAQVIANSKDLDYQRVTLVTVDYSPSPTKLPRRPLPPKSPPQLSNPRPISTAIWQPAESRSIRSRDFAAVGRNTEPQVGASPSTNQGKQLLDNLLLKLDQARKLNLPATKGLTDPKLGDRFWESSTKAKTLRSRQQKRVESDRHYGNLKSGVIFNKLPSDLMGNLQDTYQSLSRYLKRTDKYFQTRKNENAYNGKSVVYIPTGREVEEDPAEGGQNGRESHRSDVTMRYVHRDSNDTPSLDIMPWEDPHGDGEEMRNVNRKMETFKEQKYVKKLTITLPSVPPPTPDPLMRRYKNEKRNERFSSKHGVDCSCCEDLKIQHKEEVKASNAKTGRRKNMSVVSFTEPLPSTRLVHENKGFRKNWLEVKPKQYETLKEESSVDVTSHKDAPSSQNVDSLTEKLVLQHGEMKRRHQCPRKEVVIAPFSVKIDDTVVKKLEENGKKIMDPKITKPYTFSYIPSSVRKAKIPRSRELNSKIASVLRGKAHDSSFVSGFVPDAANLNSQNKVDAHTSSDGNRVRAKVQSRRKLQRITVRQAVEVDS